MFDYVFLKIINANCINMLDAIVKALGMDSYHMTDIQMTQLLILCEMQKKILLLQEHVELLEQTAGLQSELDESSSDILKLIEDKLKVVKVTVKPIEEE